MVSDAATVGFRRGRGVNKSPDSLFAFDPKLAALPLAFDLEAVTRLFQSRWINQGALQVSRVRSAQYKPSACGVITYDLLIEQPGAPPRPTIGVVEVGPTGLKARLFDDDPEIPWLAVATDAEAMRARFATVLGRPPEACAVTPIRYKPGSRVVLRYDLHTSSGQRTVFAKVLAQDDDQLTATLATLFQASQAAPAMPRILPPLAHFPELHMVVQPEVLDGVELHARVFDPAVDSAWREQWMRQVGASLAGLHASVGAPGPQRRLEDDLCELQEYLKAVARISPELTAGFEGTIVDIAALAENRAEPAPVASHGAFRTDQLMIEHEALVLLDLDSFCWANPARDVGNFLAYLNWKAMRQPSYSTFIERARRGFLEGYSAARSTLDRDWLACYEAAAMLKICGRRFRGLTFDEWHLVPHLLDSARALVGAAASPRNRLSISDTLLPSLQVALDVEAMTDTLEPLVSGQSRTAASVRGAKLLAHSPSKRAVIRYQVAGGGSVIGKLYADARQAARVYSNMSWLRGVVFADSARCGVPQPLAHSQELSMVFYLQVDGQFLDEVMVSDRVNRSIDLAGEWLAALHSHRVSIEEPLLRSTALDIRDCRDVINQSSRGHTEVVSQLAGHLENGADALCLETKVSIHRDFHYRHIIVDDGLTVIDLDEMRLGDPNYDLAHFCANLDLLAYREHKSLAALQDRFLNTYASHTDWVRDERFVYFYVYTCLKIAKQLCTMRGPSPRPEGAEQRRQVQMILGKGLAAMEGDHA